MDLVDYIFLAIVLCSVLFGVLRGFVREALSLATWILAFLLALRLGPQVAPHLRTFIASLPWRYLAADALVFFVVLASGALIMFAVAVAMRGSALAPADRMLGAGFGLLRGAFIVIAAVMLLGQTEVQQSLSWRRSVLVPPLRPLAQDLHRLIPEHWLAYLRPRPALPVAAVSRPGK